MREKKKVCRQHLSLLQLFRRRQRMERQLTRPVFRTPTRTTHHRCVVTIAHARSGSDSLTVDRFGRNLVVTAQTIFYEEQDLKVPFKE
ncbi:hypothetical protein QQF64_020300 [Cirrhinus molitorella]|uniref:Uncharacterized protein n=1 Tax=Cirrhinus molitorella TaxID=172907 RepID=A0ABR3LA96_9TELE